MPFISLISSKFLFQLLSPLKLVRYILPRKGELREDMGLNPMSAWGCWVSRWSCLGLSSFVFKWQGENCCIPKVLIVQLDKLWFVELWVSKDLSFSHVYLTHTVMSYTTSLLVTFTLFLVYISIPLCGKYFVVILSSLL